MWSLTSVKLGVNIFEWGEEISNVLAVTARKFTELNESSVKLEGRKIALLLQ